MSEEQFAQVMRWFQTLSTSFAEMKTEMKTEMQRMAQDISEIRELLAHQQDDDRVQRQAIANLDRRVDAFEHAPR